MLALARKGVMMLLFSLSFAYAKNLRTIVSNLKKSNRPIVIDWDGTCTVFAYPYYKSDVDGRLTPNFLGGLLPCADADVDRYSLTHDIYAPNSCKIIKSMQYLIKKMSAANVYILTRTDPNVVENKNACIFRNFPSINKENVIHVLNAADKIDVLRDIGKKHNAKPVFIEDTFKTILNAEEADVAIGLHMSYFLV